MDFTLSSDVLMLRDMLRRFLENEVRPLESKYFTTGTLKPEERARLRTRIEQMGLWGANLPFDLDGGELDQVTACVLEEELSQTFIPLEIGDIPPMLYACRDEQVTRFLKPVLEGQRRIFLAAREPDALRPEEWSTMAEEDPANESGYTIHGTKLLDGMPQEDDFLVVFAKTAEGITAFFLDADRDDLVFVSDMTPSNHPGISSTSLRSRGPGVHLKNCRVQENAVLGEYGQALMLGAAEAAQGWIRIGARYVGLVERLLAMSAEYARDWVVLGRPLNERPAVQRMLAEIQVQIECCRWLVYHAAWLADRQEPLRIPAAQVQLATGALLKKAIDCVTMIYGGPGPSLQTEEQRFLMSFLPHEAMDMMLESAAAVVASQILASARQTAAQRS